MWIKTLVVARVGADPAVDHKMLIESNLSLGLGSYLATDRITTGLGIFYHKILKVFRLT